MTTHANVTSSLSMSDPPEEAGRMLAAVAETVNGPITVRSIARACAEAWHVLVRVHARGVNPLEGRSHHGDILRNASRLAEAKNLRPQLDPRRFTLHSVVEAYAALIKRTARGKIVVDILGPSQ